MRQACGLSIFLLLASTHIASADIPPGPGEKKCPNPWGYGPPPPSWFEAHQPHQRPPVIAPLVVEPAAGDDRQTRLRIPASIAKPLGAAKGTVEAVPCGWEPTPTGTVVAGLAMSVAVVLGGLWIVRQPKRRWIGAAVTAATVMVVVGVAGCPPWQRPDSSTYVEQLAPLEIQDGNVLAGTALLEGCDGDEPVRLTIDQNSLSMWVTGALPAAKDESNPGPWEPNK